MEAVRRRSEGLGLLRAVASEAHKLATDAAAHRGRIKTGRDREAGGGRRRVGRRAARVFENDDRVLPVDAERAAQAPAVPRAAAGPSKLPPGDERAATLAALADLVNFRGLPRTLVALRRNSADDPAGFEVPPGASLRLVLRRALLRPGPALRPASLPASASAVARPLAGAGSSPPAAQSRRPDRGGHPPRDEGRESGGR